MAHHPHRPRLERRLETLNMRRAVRLAAGTIVFSMALIPTVTSLIVAALVGRLQREQQATQLERLDEISERLEAIERRLDTRRT